MNNPELEGPPSSSNPPLVEPLLTREGVHDYGSAKCFASQYRSQLRYCKAMDWLWFNGQYWEKEREEKALSSAGAMVEERMAAFEQLALEEKEKDKILSKLERSVSSPGLKRILKVAAADLNVDSEAFDAAPYLLNTASGVVDLRDGSLGPHDPDHLMTQYTQVEYDPDYRSELWEKTVLEIANGDVAVADFLQLIAGDACIGKAYSQRFFYFHGQGANGKSLFTDCLAQALGGFSRTGYVVAIESATLAGGKRPAGATSPDLVALRGKRLALLSEQDEAPIDPGRLKKLTGGDSITAREPHKGTVTFSPAITLIAAGNHPPVINEAGHAIRRRLVAVPFLNQFKPSNFADALQSPGTLRAILTWAVKGATKLYSLDGAMTPPPAVENASDEFWVDINVFAQWLHERCILGGGHGDTSTRILHKDFLEWCEEMREPTDISNNLFTRKIKELGHKSRKSNGSSLLCGIALKPSR